MTTQTTDRAHHKMCEAMLSKTPPMPDGSCLCGVFANSDAHLLIDLSARLKDEPTCSPEVRDLIGRRTTDAIIAALMANTNPRASDAAR